MKVVKGTLTQTSFKDGGSQCVAMALTACCMSRSLPLESWSEKEIDLCLKVGDTLYAISRSGRDAQEKDVKKSEPYLFPEEVQNNCIILDVKINFKIQKSVEFFGTLLQTEPVPSALSNDLETAFTKTFNVYSTAILTVGSYSMAVIKCGNKIFMFDSHMRTPLGLPSENGKGTAVLIRFDNEKEICGHLRKMWPKDIVFTLLAVVTDTQGIPIKATSATHDPNFVPAVTCEKKGSLKVCGKGKGKGGPSPASTLTEIVMAAIQVAGGRRPSADDLKFLRDGKNREPFWNRVVYRLHPEWNKWYARVDQLSLSYYKVGKGEDFMRELDRQLTVSVQNVPTRPRSSLPSDQQASAGMKVPPRDPLVGGVENVTDVLTEQGHFDLTNDQQSTTNIDTTPNVLRISTVDEHRDLREHKDQNNESQINCADPTVHTDTDDVHLDQMEYKDQKHEPKTLRLVNIGRKAAPGNSRDKSTPKRSLRGRRLAEPCHKTEEAGVKLNFTFQLPRYEWEAHYDKASHTLNPVDARGERLTNKLNKLFEASGNNVCVLKFNNKALTSAITDKTTSLITYTAQCNMKGCFVFKMTQTVNADDPQNYDVQVSTYGTFTHNGDKHRRHITGLEREAHKSRTKHEKPNEVKIDLIDKKRQTNEVALSLGNYNHAPSQSCSQKISSEQNLESDFDPDLWVDLEKTADQLENEYNGRVVRLLAKQPFQIIWMTDEQIKFYTSCKPPRILHLDATGSVICHVPWAMSSVHNYCITMRGGPVQCETSDDAPKSKKKGKPPVLLTEFNTEEKKTTFLTFWMDFWQDEVAKVNKSCPKPDAIVMDYNWPGIHSAARSFCDLNILQYLQSTIDAKDKDEIGHTIIQLCNAHVIHAVAMKLSKLCPRTKEGKEKRSFALHVFAALQRTDTLDAAKVIVKNCSILFESDYLTVDATQALHYLTDLLTTTEKQPYFENDPKEPKPDDVKSQQPDDITFWQKSPFTKFFEDVVYTVNKKPKDSGQHQEDKKPKDSEQGQQDGQAEGSNNQQQAKNPFHIPNFMSYLQVRFLALYPLWSCFTIRLLGYKEENPPSNWPAETYFNITKHQILQSKLHQKPGRYLRTAVPKVQARLSDAKYDVDYKTNKSYIRKKPLKTASNRKKRKVKSEQKNGTEDKRHAVDRWKSRRGTYSLTKSRDKYGNNDAVRALVDSVFRKNAELSVVREEEEDEDGALQPQPLPADEGAKDAPATIIALTHCKRRLFASPVKIVQHMSPTGRQETRRDSPDKLTLITDKPEKRADRPDIPVESTDKPLPDSTNAHYQALPWEAIQTWPFSEQELLERGSEELCHEDGEDTFFMKNLSCLFLPPSEDSDVGLAWLNCYVINRFLSTRCQIAGERNLKAYNFSSQFLGLVVNNDARLSHIKKEMKADIASKDLLLVPYNISQTHWVLIVVVFKLKVLIFIDSKAPAVDMSSGDTHLSPNEDVAAFLLPFLASQYLSKFKTTLDWTSDWTFYYPLDVGTQTNLYDCGVHVCLWAHVICTGTAVNPGTSTQMRQWIMTEILERRCLRSSPKKKKGAGDARRVTCNRRFKPRWRNTPPAPFQSCMEYCSRIAGNFHVPPRKRPRAKNPVEECAVVGKRAHQTEALL